MRTAYLCAGDYVSDATLSVAENMAGLIEGLSIVVPARTEPVLLTWRVPVDVRIVDDHGTIVAMTRSVTPGFDWLGGRHLLAGSKTDRTYHVEPLSRPLRRKTVGPWRRLLRMLRG